MERLDKDNQDQFIASTIIRGRQFDFYKDDYGQCYYFEWFDDELNGLCDMPCGSYNFNYYEEAIHYLDPKGWYVSLWGIDSWNEVMKERESKGLPSIDYDDYGIYDIEGFYKEHEK